jgi:2,5-diketo-D-gluconate reductase A
MAEVPKITLSDGNEIPQFGLGVFQVPPSDTARVCLEAFAAGYRMIDTAEGYYNEQGVGDAIAQTDVPREELFITSKLANSEQGYDTTMRAFDETMTKLGVEVLDLFLIHWPQPALDKYVETWKAFVELHKAGRVASVGVSNFDPDHIERIVAETGVAPVVDQIELHPTFQQRDKRDYLAEHSIAIQSWRPLGRGILSMPVLAEIGARHAKSPAQVVLRWHVQQGLIVFPKTVHPHRLRENIDVFDFELGDEDMAAIDALEHPSGRTGPDPARWAPG